MGCQSGCKSLNQSRVVIPNIDVLVKSSTFAATVACNLVQIVDSFPEFQSNIELVTQLATSILKVSVEYGDTKPEVNVLISTRSPSVKRPKAKVCEEAPVGYISIGGIDELYGHLDPPENVETPTQGNFQQVSRCKAFLLEILRRAAHDWVLYRQHTKLAMREIAQDAYTWLFEEDQDHSNWKERKESSVLCDDAEIIGVKSITSFLSICEVLDLDPSTVRARVRKLTIAEIIAAGRPAESRRCKVEEQIAYDECETSVDLDSICATGIRSDIADEFNMLQGHSDYDF